MLRRGGISCAMGMAIVAVSLLTLAAAPGSARSASAPRLGRGDSAPVTVLGVERDRRFGRAWLLVRLASEGHLRTVSSSLKAFAPPGEYEAGFARIPLIPKLPDAKLLRRKGRASVTVEIYFGPPGRLGTTVRRTLILFRTLPTRSAAPVH